MTFQLGQMHPSRAACAGGRPRWRKTSLLALTTVACLSWAQLWHRIVSTGDVEPQTGVNFPSSLGKLPLVGLGVRRKFGAIKVYAVGFYLAADSKLWGQEPTSEKILTEALGKSALRMVITSSLVTPAKLAAALEESLEPRLEGLSAADQKMVLSEFSTAITSGPPLAVGQVLLFSLDADGVQVEAGSHVVKVKGPALSKALLAIYVDDAAVSPGLKDAIFSKLQKGL